MTETDRLPDNLFQKIVFLKKLNNRIINEETHPKAQEEYSDDGFSGYTVSSLKTVRHRYILFVFMVCSAFFRLQSGFSIPWALKCKTLPLRSQWSSYTTHNVQQDSFLVLQKSRDSLREPEVIMCPYGFPSTSSCPESQLL